MRSYEVQQTKQQQQEQLDIEIGTAARLLHQRGEIDAVLLLLSARSVHCEWEGDDYDFNYYRYYLEVDLSTVEDLTSEVEDQIKHALNLVQRHTKCGCAGITLYPSPVEGDWRGDLRNAMSSTPTNQASLVSLPNRYPTKDKMRFRDGAEVRLYEGLVRTQERLPNEATITIAPNPSVRVLGHTWEPDFLVTYGGKCGVIEVDGYTHQKRWASDKSKDALYEDAGIAYVSRVSVEDTEDPALVDQAIARFLNRLANH